MQHTQTTIEEVIRNITYNLNNIRSNKIKRNNQAAMKKRLYSFTPILLVLSKLVNDKEYRELNKAFRERGPLGDWVQMVEGKREAM